MFERTNSSKRPNVRTDKKFKKTKCPNGQKVQKDQMSERTNSSKRPNVRTDKKFKKAKCPNGKIVQKDEMSERTNLSLIHISEPTRLLSISYAVFCLKKKKKQRNKNT